MEAACSTPQAEARSNLIVLHAYGQVKCLGRVGQHASALPHELYALNLIIHQQCRRLVHIEEALLQWVQVAVICLQPHKAFQELVCPSTACVQRRFQGCRYGALAVVTRLVNLQSLQEWAFSTVFERSQIPALPVLFHFLRYKIRHRLEAFPTFSEQRTADPDPSSVLNCPGFVILLLARPLRVRAKVSYAGPSKCLLSLPPHCKHADRSCRGCLMLIG